MRSLILGIAFCIQIGFLSAQARSTGATEENSEEQIKQLEAQRSKAQVEGDVRKLDELLAAEFVEMNTAGKVRTKAQNLEGHRSAQVHWQKFDLDDLHVHVAGDTAVVTGHLIRKGTVASRDLSGETRYTRYYLKRDGRWQAIFQYSVPYKVTE